MSSVFPWERAYVIDYSISDDLKEVGVTDLSETIASEVELTKKAMCTHGRKWGYFCPDCYQPKEE